LGRLKFRERYLVGDIVKKDGNRHIYADILDFAVDNVAFHAGPFIQLDYRHGIGKVLLKGRVIGLAKDGKGVDFAFSAQSFPIELKRMAAGADDACGKTDVAALPALLHSQFVPMAIGPVGRRVSIYNRKGLIVAHRVTSSK
jgi:hypothetical protein